MYYVDAELGGLSPLEYFRQYPHRAALKTLVSTEGNISDCFVKNGLILCHADVDPQDGKAKSIRDSLRPDFMALAARMLEGISVDPFELPVKINLGPLDEPSCTRDRFVTAIRSSHGLGKARLSET